MLDSLKALLSKALIKNKENNANDTSKPSFFKKLRQKTGSPLVWGSIAVFSPTLVACYGQPYDMENYELKYTSAECLDGYIKIYADCIDRDTGLDTNVKYSATTSEECNVKDSVNQMICKVCTLDAEYNDVLDCSSYCNDEAPNPLDE